MMMPILTQSMHPGTVPDPSQLMAQMAPVQLMNLVQIAFSVVGFAIINAAVCRAVLEPENDRSFYLRLGAQELWQGLVLLVLYVLAVFAAVAAFVPMIIIGVVGGIAVANGGQSGLAMIPVVVLLVVAVMVALGYCWLRLSMALPMSFVHRQFRLFESWNFTKGNTARLLGLGALVAIVALMAEIVVFLVLGAIGGTMFVMGGGAALVQQLSTQSPAEWLPKIAVWGIPAAAVFSAVVGYFLAFWLAPWAEAYRQIAGPNYADVFSDTPAPVTP
jgi:hypothetical protein